VYIHSKNVYTYVASVCPKRTLHTGWRRPMGCLKLQVIFRKRATNYRALLRKMTSKHKASCGYSPPCMYIRRQTIATYVCTILCIYTYNIYVYICANQFIYICTSHMYMHIQRVCISIWHLVHRSEISSKDRQTLQMYIQYMCIYIYNSYANQYL